MESVTILTRTSRSKKLEVKGGFYSKEDMKNELGYATTPSSMQLKRQNNFKCRSFPSSPRIGLPNPRSRIDKVVAWAEKKGLVRTPCLHCVSLLDFLHCCHLKY